MSVRSPSAASGAATVSMPLPTGRLSPVSAASATSSVAADSTRPSAGTTSPASISTTSPGHELLGGQLGELAVAAHARLDDHHLRQRRDRRGGLALLAEAEHGVEQRQQQDHDPGAGLLDRVDRDDAGGQEHDLHRVAELAQERVPARLGLGLGEAIGPVALRGAGRPPRWSARARARRAAPAPRLHAVSTCQVGVDVAGSGRAVVAAICAESVPTRSIRNGAHLSHSGVPAPRA